MATFWERVRALFAGGGDPDAARRELEARVRAVVLEALRGRTPFTPLEVVREIFPPLERGPQQLAAVADVLDRLWGDKHFEPFAFARERASQYDGGWRYVPAERASSGARAAQPSPSTPPSPSSGARAAPASSARQPPQQPAGFAAPSPATAGGSGASGGPFRAPATPVAGAPYRTAQNPFAAPPGILGLSPEEVRRRSLRIDPYRTAWIGRVDTIPPQSDERTALIDRGLILRGLLTEDQITEIHRVGDLWLRYHDAARLAESQAQAQGRAALEQVRRQRAERKADKQRAARERDARRREEVARRRREDIVYLGRGVSGRLGDRRSNVEALVAKSLPVLATPADVAHALGVTVPRLRWLCFHAEVVAKGHYAHFEVPKRSGGTRLLSAPHARLAAAQAWVLREVLAKLPTEPAAHGFVPGRSTVTNAAPHVGRDVVVNLDLSDFFPTITFGRVRGVFHRLGYSPAVATVLALLCTEPPRRLAALDGARCWVAVGARALPQGACTSPALSNQVARKLDRRLAGMTAKLGWAYTRYADDLTFSAPEGKKTEIALLLARVRRIVEAEGFAINPKKGRIQRAMTRQTVTGIVVNERVGIPREEVRRLRAILHGAKATGLAAQNREGIPHFEAWLRGKLAYLAMVDRSKGAAMLRALDALTG